MQDEANNQLFDIDNGSSFRVSEPLSTPHRDNILKINYSPTNKRFLTVSKDGTVCSWSEHFRLLKSFKNVGYSNILLLKNSFQPDQNKISSLTVNSKASFRERWALDFVLMENIYSLAISTDDHEITFYGKCSI